MKKLISKKNRFSFTLLASGIVATAVGCSADDPSSNGAVPGKEGQGTVKGVDDVRATCESDKIGPRMLRRLTKTEVEFTLRQVYPALNSGWLGVKLSADPVGTIGFTTDADGLLVGTNTAKEMLKTAEDVGDIVTADGALAEVLPCSAAAADAACAKEYVQTYGYLLFRRPLAEAEVTKFADYATSVAGRSDFKTGIKWVTVALIQSPYAFYRSELGEDKGDHYALSQFELATELAYTYGGTGPDKELLDLASAGKLVGGDVLHEQASRLLDKEIRISGGAGKWRALDYFFEEWLEYRKVLGQSRDADPTFATDLSAYMVTETRSFLLTQILGEKATLQDLMTTQTTYVNGPLAAFYGFGDASAGVGDFRPAERADGQGVGLLAQSSLLAATAHQSETSPTLRGLMFYRRFLCNPRPTPPAVVPTLESTNVEGTAKTTREKFENFHIKKEASCANCHQHFEPFGYTLEHFDETGRFRAMEGTEPINAATTVVMNDESEVDVDGQEALANLIESSDEVENCITGLMANFYFSGAGATNCLNEESRRKVAAGEMNVLDYYLGLVDAPQFTKRSK